MPFDIRRWRTVWVLLGLGLPITIALTAAAGMWLCGLPLGLAILLAAILAPTDPVLAHSVQVAPPGKGDEGELRFALTAEAGLNDGLAFPFVALGILLMEDLPATQGIAEWLLRDLLIETAGAALFGMVFGKATVFVNEALPERLQIHQSQSAFVAMGLAFFAYGSAELVYLNGFVAVFATAVSIRNLVRSTDYLRRLHSFSGEVERIVTALVMAVFGGTLGGGLIGAMHWRLAIFAAIALFAARSLSLLVAAPLSRLDRRETVAAGYLGIRGLASLYYLFFVLAEYPHIAGLDRIVPFVGFAVLASTVLYGFTGDLAMRWVRPAPRLP
jgi:NhaP-type Na+/H+ or K+/H+ antiporter